MNLALALVLGCALYPDPWKHTFGDLTVELSLDANHDWVLSGTSKDVKWSQKTQWSHDGALDGSGKHLIVWVGGLIEVRDPKTGEKLRDISASKGLTELERQRRPLTCYNETMWKKETVGHSTLTVVVPQQDPPPQITDPAGAKFKTLPSIILKIDLETGDIGRWPG